MASWQAWFYQSGYLRARGRKPIPMTSAVVGKIQVSRVQVTSVSGGVTPLPIPPNSILVPAGADLQAAVNAAAGGSTLALTASASQPYRIQGTLNFKTNMQLFSNSGAVVKGSDILTGWVSDGSGHWYISGALPGAYSDAGQCNINSGAEGNPCQKREDVFRDGVQLKRYMALSNLVAGGFMEDYAANRIYVADDPSGHLLEVSSTPFAINTTVSGGNLYGISFQQFAPPSQQGAVQVGGTGWLVDTCDFSDNHAIGFRFSSSTNSTIQNSTMNRNGQMGAGCYASTNCSWINNELSYNNHMRDYWALDWESGGIKFAQATACTFKGNYSHHNNGVGIWFDIDNQDNIVDSNRSWDNASCGIRYEISFDAKLINNDTRRNGYGHKQSAIWRNGTDGGPFATGGINVNCSGGGYSSMNGIHIYGNYSEDDQNMIHVQARSPVSGHVGDPYWGRGPSAKYPSRNWITQNVHVHDNTMVRRDFADDSGSYGSTGFGVLNISTDVPWHSMGNTWGPNNIYRFTSTAKSRFQWWKTSGNNQLPFSGFITCTDATSSTVDQGGSVNVAP